MNNSSTEFEKWYSSIGGYGDAHKKDLWECWKASRAALCVEIPKDGEASSFGDWVVFDTEVVQEMLDSAGVRYK